MNNITWCPTCKGVRSWHRYEDDPRNPLRCDTCKEQHPVDAKNRKDAGIVEEQT
jgi:hypothetical protein